MRPDFNELEDYNEFLQYYWYRDELKEICKGLGIDPVGTKCELEERISEYFKGNIISKKKNKRVYKGRPENIELTLDTPLLECNFAMNDTFRSFFSKQIGISNFKFKADMASTVKKVREEDDRTFTLRDLLDVYYGRSDYAHYDNSSCQWNKFYKDFCADSNNHSCKNKLKAAAKLWSIVRDSRDKKIYTENLLRKYAEMIEEFYR